MRLCSMPGLGALMRGMASQCSSSSSSTLTHLPGAAAVQWPSLPQAHRCLQPPQHQAGSSRSLSFLSSAAAAAALQQQGTCLTQAATASPVQQLARTQPLLPPPCAQLQLQPHQQAPLLHGLGQQVRHFVLMPRRVKYRKAHKSMGFNETICPNTRQLAFGLYGIRALEHCRIPAGTLEAIRRTLRRTVKKSTMMWIRVTPNVPVTSKPAEVRMGKGKGTLDYWAAPIRAGQIIFEFDRCSKATAMQAVQAIKAKMPIKVDFVEWT